MKTYRVNYCVPTMGYTMGCGDSPILEYSLNKLDHALSFQIHRQSPAVSAILKQKKFKASNGVIIDVSQNPELINSNPEFQIFLRGENSITNSRPDTVSFSHNFKRDKAYGFIKDALKEFSQFVKSNTYSIMPGYSCSAGRVRIY